MQSCILTYFKFYRENLRSKAEDSLNIYIRSTLLKEPLGGFPSLHFDLTLSTDWNLNMENQSTNGRAIQNTNTKSFDGFDSRCCRVLCFSMDVGKRHQERRGAGMDFCQHGHIYRKCFISFVKCQTYICLFWLDRAALCLLPWQVRQMYCLRFRMTIENGRWIDPGRLTPSQA